MAFNEDTRVWVVFEGHKPEIYHSWPQAGIQVNGYKGQLHKAYDCYDQAVAEWRKYCLGRELDKEFIRAHMHIDHEAGSSSNEGGGEISRKIRRMPGNLAEDTSSDEFIMQHSMQRQLVLACNILGYETPTYKLHEVKHIDGVEYHRFYAALARDSTGRPVVSLGRFGKTDHDAMEDAAAMLLQKVMGATGKNN